MINASTNDNLTHGVEDSKETRRPDGRHQQRSPNKSSCRRASGPGGRGGTCGNTVACDRGSRHQLDVSDPGYPPASNRLHLPRCTYPLLTPVPSRPDQGGVFAHDLGLPLAVVESETVLCFRLAITYPPKNAPLSLAHRRALILPYIEENWGTSRSGSRRLMWGRLPWV